MSWLGLQSIKQTKFKKEKEKNPIRLLELINIWISEMVNNLEWDPIIFWRSVMGAKSIKGLKGWRTEDLWIVELRSVY